jgi:predicted nuclease of restriction endonuclease-like RecB superfamily
MRFSLQDVKRQVRRRNGELAVTLHFLHSAELRSEIERLIAYYAQQCGQPRHNFLQDEASSCIGDYRLAHCLLSTMSFWYVWQQPAWSDCLQQLSAAACLALEQAEIYSSLQLRLALFDYVNLKHSGFLDEQTRPAALNSFAARFSLDMPRLTYLLALDTEDEAILTQATLEPPTADAVAALYNQWVFEAALFNASEVQFSIDCEAFLTAQRIESTGAATGIGAVIKRLCYLAHKLGVYYDLAYEATQPGERTTLLHLTLYGPQEMTGSPQQYGQRLARLCRLLLHSGNESSPAGKVKRRSAVALKGAIHQADATVHISQQAYHFQMDANLLALLPTPTQATGQVAEAAVIYDSSIEQSFAEAFAALEHSHATDGWQLEREPEPLLLEGPTQGIFIPDFALTRGKRHIYVEILGFWTPAYRERKLQKLHYLKGHTDLILALPVEAHQAFASLAGDFPLIEYNGQLSATELLRVMQTHYDDFSERLADLDVTDIQAIIRNRHFIPERACYELLHCYRRAELSQAVALVLAPDIAHRAGLGLYLQSWLEHLRRSFVEWIEAKGVYELSLSTCIQEWQTLWMDLATCDETTIEALINLWSEVQIQRTSIFDAKLLVVAYAEQKQLEKAAAISVEEEDADTKIALASRKIVRARRAINRKSSQKETNQQNLWEL